VDDNDLEVAVPSAVEVQHDRAEPERVGDRRGDDLVQLVPADTASDEARHVEQCP
jgi:hypothetical protein